MVAVLVDADERVRVERCYRPESNVFELTFSTDGGVARVTESLNSNSAGRLPWGELARRIEGLSGSVEFRIDVRIEHGSTKPHRGASRVRTAT